MQYSMLLQGEWGWVQPPSSLPDGATYRVKAHEFAVQASKMKYEKKRVR
jgi:hypothetical protein